MKRSSSFSAGARIRSFTYAFDGILAFFKSEHNALLHLLATVLVSILAILVPLSRMELVALIMTVGFVWAMEILNTAIEKIMDLVVPAKLPAVKVIKDISAAAVLIAAITALITGCIIFIPKLI